MGRSYVALPSFSHLLLPIFRMKTTIPTQTSTALSQLQLLQKVFLALCTCSVPLLWATSRAAQPACPLSVVLLPHGGEPMFVPLFVHSFLHLFIHSRNNDWAPMMGKVLYQLGPVTATNKTHGPCLHGAPVWLARRAQEQGVRWGRGYLVPGEEGPESTHWKSAAECLLFTRPLLRHIRGKPRRIGWRIAKGEFIY